MPVSSRLWNMFFCDNFVEKFVSDGYGRSNPSHLFAVNGMRYAYPAHKCVEAWLAKPRVARTISKAKYCSETRLRVEIGVNHLSANKNTSSFLLGYIAIFWLFRHLSYHYYWFRLVFNLFGSSNQLCDSVWGVRATQIRGYGSIHDL